MIAMHPLFRKWLTIFLVVLLFGVLGGGLAVGALIGYLESMPPIHRLENYNPPEISRVYDRSGNRQLGEFYSDRRQLVRIKDIPEHVQNAFLAIEDERFHNHFGVDIRGIGRAVVENLRSGGKSQGASTITMQVARNVVLEDLSKNFMRKFTEVLLALQMERDFSKDQILEFYLNHIFFGARAYGIQEASRVYFSKDVKDLNVVEAAMLAGLPKAPSSLSPFNNKEMALNRRNQVLFNMRRIGYIKSETEYRRLAAIPIELNPPPPNKTEAPYFVDYVSNVLIRTNNLEKSNDLGQKAYQIISTVDLELQKIVEEELSKALREVEIESESQKEARLGAENLGGVARNQHRLARITEVGDEYIRVSVRGHSAKVPLPAQLPFFYPEKALQKGKLIDIYIASVGGKNGMEAYLYDKAHVQGAAVLLDNKTGEILALVGGDDRNDAANNGEWNRAFQGGSQPGSCWKPLLYAGALDAVKDGEPMFTPGTVIQDEPYSVGGWAPKNYEGRFYGPTSFYEALVKSRNIPTVKIFTRLGADRSVKIYNSFNTVVRPSDWDIPRYAPVSLGTPDINPLELASAYAVLANHGIGIQPTPIKRLFSSKSASDSKVIKPEEFQVVSPQAAYMTTRILQDVVSQGTAKSTIGNWIVEENKKGRKIPEMAGKTGTTNDCFDAWYVGYTPDVTLAINIGFDQQRSLGPKMTGGKVVGPIYVAMMDRILKTRTDWQMKFTPPSGIVFRDICSKSGKLVTSGCYSSGQNVFKNAAFKTGTEPEGGCPFHGGGRTASYEQASEDPEAQYQMQSPQQFQPQQYQQTQPASQQQYYQQVQPQASYYGYQ
jgi:penicillin-binding protein 1A